MSNIKNVYFTDSDKELLMYCNSLPNFSAWVKQKALIEKHEKGIEKVVNDIIDKRLGDSKI